MSIDESVLPQPPRSRRRSRSAVPSRALPSRFLAAADFLTASLLLFAIIFSPWAFGTTQPWSIRTMNVAGYLLGFLLLLKLALRRWSGLLPQRWTPGADAGPATWLPRLLAVLTAMILGYVLVSGLNARASYDPGRGVFDYHECLPWLPHSYDRGLTFALFGNCLALACVFWAARDWLLGKTSGEALRAPDTGRRGCLPARLRLLLWVLCVNGGLVALEGLLQRAWGTSHLLWLVKPIINQAPESQFGPYAYRANAAQLFNLVWPVGVGFWWLLQRAARHGDRRRSSHHFLLSCVLVMLVSALISLSRGAALVALGSLFLVAVILLSRLRQLEFKTRIGIFALFAAALCFAGVLGWEALAGRFTRAEQEFKADRLELWVTVWPMVRQNLWLGAGPGTMSTTLQLAPGLPPERWYAQLHNDFLETLATFGIAGSIPILLALGAALACWFYRSGIPVSRVLVYHFWVALAGLLAHAAADFPLQIYSLLFLVILYCAILSALARR